MKEWRKLVILNEGYAYRYLCKRLEKILKADIQQLRTNTQNTISMQKNTKEATNELRNKIIEWLITPGSDPLNPNRAIYEGEGDPRTVLEKHLKQAIKVITTKVDDRTIQNYIKRLELHRCIRISGSHRYEFLDI